MSRAILRAVSVAVVLLAVIPRSSAKLVSKCPTGFANFGDSLTDTGNALNSYYFTGSADTSPYGETFFGKPAKRFCNGRVVPDFFSLAFRVPLLDGYFATISFDYKHGINFAVSGATAAPTATAIVPLSVVPFQLGFFSRFKESVGNTTIQGKRCADFDPNLPTGPDPYSKWLYTIEAGGNDILSAITTNVSLPEILSDRLPKAIGNISLTIQTLYSESARKFLVFNIPPQGCSTVIFVAVQGQGLPTDSLGCVIAINELVSAFNTGLNLTLQALRTQLPDAEIALFDYNSANLEILENAATYGFDPSLIFTACCGNTGVSALNYNPNDFCASPGTTVCANPEEHIIWDGIHFTEHFYRIISKFALSGQFTDNGVNYTADCILDFSLFGPQATYREAYPLQCDNLFG